MEGTEIRPKRRQEQPQSENGERLSQPCAPQEMKRIKLNI